MQRRLKESGGEVARLQDELGRERKRRHDLAEQLDGLRQELAELRQRLAERKRQQAEAKTPGERERELQQQFAELRHELQILQQKFEIVETERQDLRAVLEDHDRFLEQEPEEVASFRERPLQPEERELAARLTARAQAGVPRYRVLVIGGGEPQLRHRDKFLEFGEVLGFAGEWRMAEYTSWQREMERLENDMRQRFDALVILHWNRTTFAHHARAICNQVGQKPCLTCHYHGFTSLRRSLQETLRQLLAWGQI